MTISQKLLPQISHELRNHLSPIFSLSEMIKNEVFGRIDDEKNKQEYLNAAEIIYDSAQNMLEILNDLMAKGDINFVDNSKSDNCQNKIDADYEFNICPQEIDIISLMKQTIRIIQSCAVHKNIAILFDEKSEFSLQKQFSKIHLDPKRTKQILINLLSNSIKYSPANSKILISCDFIKQNDKNYLTISVKDQGIGMTKKQIQMALNGKGKEIDKSELITESNPNIDSHGIGLPLVKKLTEMQGGKLEITSIRNQGTDVLAFFPLV